MLTFTRKFARELVRRGVLRAVGAYAAIVWLLAQGVVDVFPAIGLPDWAVKGFLIISIAATPVVAIVSWKYDLSIRGFLPDKRDVAAAQSAEALAGNAPTQKSATEAGPAMIVHAHWVDQHKQACNQEFNKRFVVGRDYNADIRLLHSCVSRRHVEIYPRGEDWYIKDLGSLNGSYVNGKKIDEVKLEGETSVSLDSNGPVVSLVPRIADPTRISTKSA